MGKIMSKTVVLVRERKYELYLVDVPVYRGMESWSGLKEEAYQFENEEEASTMTEGLLMDNPDLIFVHINVEDSEKAKNKRGFQLSVDYAPYSSRLWFVKNKTEVEALNIVFKDATGRSDVKIKKAEIRNKG